jgi:hypothetical protein
VSIFRVTLCWVGQNEAIHRFDREFSCPRECLDEELRRLLKEEEAATGRRLFFRSVDRIGDAPVDQRVGV